MSRAALYVRFNSQSHREFLYMKRKYFEKINVKENCQVLDIGCGPGDVTRYKLLPFLPKSTMKLVGIDTSAEMIEYARKYHQDDDRVSYQVLDIACSTIPTQFVENFDYAYSFYSLHWAQDLRKAMSNINHMLKPRGEIFVNLMSHCYLFDMYEKLWEMEKWKPYLLDYKNVTSLFQNKKNSKENFKNVLQESGFKINICDQIRKVIVYSKSNFEGTMKAINYVKIPKLVENQFVFDQFNVMKEKNKVFANDFDEDEVYYPYTLIIAHASKI